MRMIREGVVVQMMVTLDLLNLMMVDIADIRLDVVVQLLRARGEVVQFDGGLDVYEQIVRRLRYRFAEKEKRKELVFSLKRLVLGVPNCLFKRSEVLAFGEQTKSIHQSRMK